VTDTIAIVQKSEQGRLLEAQAIAAWSTGSR
jgi:hypothetical protein